MSLTRIGSIGINTGIAFAGVTTIVTLNTANDALSIGATVNVGSGITLGASGDIFATGVSTFSGNLKVGSGVTISPDGDGFFTGVITATSYSGIDLSAVTGATGDFSIADKIVHTGDTDTAIRFPSADTITAETGGSERLRITSAGNLALGNDGSFPIYTETNDRNFILGTGSDDAAIQLHSGTAKFGGLYFGDATSGGDRYVGYIEYKHDDNYLRIATGGTEKARFDSSGRFGLGTNSPDTLLHLNASSGSTLQRFQSSSHSSYIAQIQANDNVSNGSVAGELHLRGQSGFSVSANNGTATHLRIDSDGDVLVGGHTAPLTTYQSSQTRLSIHKSSGSGAYLELGGAQNTNGTSAGTILFVNDNNADAANNDADGKILAMQRVEIVTSDSNAGDDSGGDLVFMTKPETGNLNEALRIESKGHVRFGSSGDATDSAWSDSSYGNTEVAIDGGGGYAVLHMRGDGAGSTATRWSMGVGDDKFYMAYDDVDGAHRMVMNGSGVLSIPVGIELGSGVDGSPTNNILDDYEEGTFTPSFSQGYAYVDTITYTNQTGHYTKIGNQVFAYIYMRASGNSAHSGNVITDGNGLTVIGLPFTCNNIGANEGGGYITYTNGFFGSNVSAASMHTMPWVPLNGTRVIFHTPEDGGNLTGNETTPTNRYLIFQIRYHVGV